MTWQPLAERFANLPLILSGPMLRRVEPQSVSVWLALKEPRTVTLRVYAQNEAGELVQQFEGTSRTIRLGDHLHLITVTAHATNEQERLAWGKLYYYDLFFQSETLAEHTSVPTTAAHLDTPGILNNNRATANERPRLVYPDQPLPSFMIPPEDLNQLRILHGSCRKPHGGGKEMLSAIDIIIESAIHDSKDAGNRPQQLFMTGDQIYADDVATPLLFMLIDASNFLLAGNTEELLPLHNGNVPGRQLPPGGRTDVIRNEALFSTTTPQNHLITLAEFTAMYMFIWSDMLWPQDLPTIEEFWQAYPQMRPQPSLIQDARTKYTANVTSLCEFRNTLPMVRRALAHIPTYMICDDHDVTDDWFLDGAWCHRVLASPVGKRIVRNALLTYCLFQGWGNTPHQFEQSNGVALLQAIDEWRGDETDARAATIAEVIGLPSSFSGTGTLPRSPRPLHYYYSYAGPHHQIIVMDTRNHRLYRSPSEFPGLLSPQAIHTQIVDQSRSDVDVTIIISASPVLGVELLESLQYWHHLRAKDNYAVDAEAWGLEWGTFQHFLRTVSKLRRVVFLSGDVHYAFGSSLQYWDRTDKVTAHMIDFTSSPLRNEGSGLELAVLSVGYPRFSQFFGRQAMGNMDFFAWDTIGLLRNRRIFRKILRILLSRFYALPWLLPRLIDARRSRYEIVMPAQGWPHHAFDKFPPNRSYRLHYLADTLYHTSETGDDGEEASQEHMTLAKWGLRLIRAAFFGVSFLERRVSKGRKKLVQKTAGAQEAPKGTRHIVRGTIQGAGKLEDKLERRKHTLAEAIFHREEWLSQWKAGVHIVGYANLGDIGFYWTDDEKNAVQRLWWWHPDNPERPTLATEYHASLELPELDEAPQLP